MFRDSFDSLPPEYHLVWAVYFACVGIVFLVGWRWTRWIKPALVKHIVRFGILGALLIPMPHTTVDALWVPAIGVAAVGGVIEGAEVMQRALRVMGYGAIFGAALGLIPGIIETLLIRRRKQAAGDGAANQQATRTEPTADPA